jgi:hypothetical protein
MIKLNHPSLLSFEIKPSSQPTYAVLNFQFEKYRYHRKTQNALFFFVKERIFCSEVCRNIFKKSALKKLF